MVGVAAPAGRCCLTFRGCNSVRAGPGYLVGGMAGAGAGSRCPASLSEAISTEGRDTVEVGGGSTAYKTSLDDGNCNSGGEAGVVIIYGAKYDIFCGVTLEMYG